VYVIAAFLVRLAEHLVPLIIKYGSFREAIERLADEVVWPHFWIIYLWLSVLLFVYCALRELSGRSAEIGCRDCSSEWSGRSQ
jgi:hypothetical protein